MLLDASYFWAPQRRTRVWMWVIRADIAAAPAAAQVVTILDQLQQPEPVPLTTFLAGRDGGLQPRQALNERGHDALEALLSSRPLQRLSQADLEVWVVDVSKSAGHASLCFGATPV